MRTLRQPDVSLSVSHTTHNRMAAAADRVRRCWPLYLTLIVVAIIPLSFVGVFVLRPYVHG